MKIQVNGQAKDIRNEDSVASLIAGMNIRQNASVAELNGRILKMHEWDGTRLSDGDKLEIISFVGGG